MKRGCFLFSLVTVVVCMLTACHRPMMDEDNFSYANSQNVAIITFYRPFSEGIALNRSPIGIKKAGNKIGFVGVLDNFQKIRYRVPSGWHTFFISGEKADLLTGQFVAGKKYYVFIKATPGKFATLFEARIQTKKDLADAEIVKEIKNCDAIKPNELAKRYFENHIPQLQKKLRIAESLYKKERRNTVRVSDGVEALY